MGIAVRMPFPPAVKARQDIKQGHGLATLTDHATIAVLAHQPDVYNATVHQLRQSAKVRRAAKRGVGQRMFQPVCRSCDALVKRFS